MYYYIPILLIKDYKFKNYLNLNGCHKVLKINFFI